MDFASLTTPWIVVAVASCLTAITDIWRFKVYNILTFPMFFAGIFYHGWINGWQGISVSLLGGAFGFFALLFPYLLGGLGAGDVKFSMAIGAWLGLQYMLPVVVVGCFAAGIYSLILIAKQRGWKGIRLQVSMMFYQLGFFTKALLPGDDREDFHDWLDRPDRRSRLIPFSAMMAIGVFACVLTLVFGR